MLNRSALALLSFAFTAGAALPPPATDFSGPVTAVTDKAITVKGRVGDRQFQIYPGTVFGAGNRQKLADFKPGTHVIVVFSESFGVWKAENIRTAPAPKPGAAPAANTMPGIKPMPKPVSTVGTTHSKK